MGFGVNLAEDVPSVIELSTAIVENLSWALCSAVGGIRTMHFKSSYSIFRAPVCNLFGINKRSTKDALGRGPMHESFVTSRMRQTMPIIREGPNLHRTFNPVRNIDAK